MRWSQAGFLLAWVGLARQMTWIRPIGLRHGLQQVMNPQLA
jgi:hypothetical protein